MKPELIMALANYVIEKNSEFDDWDYSLELRCPEGYSFYVGIQCENEAGHTKTYARLASYDQRGFGPESFVDVVKPLYPDFQFTVV